MMRFENKVAIVTGGGDGIGYGITERLSSEGANVMVVDFNSEIGSQSVSEIVDSILKLKYKLTPTSTVFSIIDLGIVKAYPSPFTIV